MIVSLFFPSVKRERRGKYSISSCLTGREESRRGRVGQRLFYAVTCQNSIVKKAMEGVNNRLARKISVYEGGVSGGEKSV